MTIFCGGGKGADEVTVRIGSNVEEVLGKFKVARLQCASEWIESVLAFPKVRLCLHQ